MRRFSYSSIKIKGGVLDGYYILTLSKCELPNEVITLKISHKDLININQQELKFFENLSYIDADHNNLNLDNFFCLKNLKKLSLSSNNIQNLPLLERKLKNLEFLDLSFNSILNWN